ncbi:uroporphyrinogen-III C-methyltransferase [uncultured Thiothrix sp.]|uniref:uroporphyrinogen-III C-methyltransferase n=1 Tax=uncultured Thiothrix sp. TaxID=223185 RepID=UPI002613C3EE|nr:uroporphyrinogen-III C-methyltransferase [uncultured Thiothrix sp.]HMT92155.1 uroporphyrinogen-III C-methyltransferase [Thiolinea sp.]
MIEKSETTAFTESHYLSSHPKAKSASFALFIAFLALFFTVVGIATGYKHWQRMNTKANDSQVRITKLDKTLSQKADSSALGSLRKDVNQTVEKLSTEANTNLQKMAQMNHETRQFAETVTTQVQQITTLQARLQQTVAPKTGHDWQIEEVAFLLRMANQELHLTATKGAALAALKEADLLLGKLGSVSFLPVRQQLAKDIASLEAFAEPDLIDLSQRINTLSLELSTQLAKSLPSPASSPAKTNEANTNEDHSLWQEYKRKALNTLNEAVIVHQVDQPLANALDTESRQSLHQLLLLRLENLRLMALQRQDQSYHQQIALIRDTLQAYYPKNQATTLIEPLLQLDQLNLQPALPDISASLAQLEKARNATLAGERKP